MVISVKYTIRPIEPRDDKAVERIIRYGLIEHGANHEGTAWCDKNLSCFSKVYAAGKRKYFVAENESGELVACGGIGELTGAEGVCELQRMFAMPTARGTGVAKSLLEHCLEFAKQYYNKCYLETLSNMTRAQSFYEKNGFTRLDSPLVSTGHFACDMWYIKNL